MTAPHGLLLDTRLDIPRDLFWGAPGRDAGFFRPGFPDALFRDSPELACLTQSCVLATEDGRARLVPSVPVQAWIRNPGQIRETGLTAMPGPVHAAVCRILEYPVGPKFLDHLPFPGDDQPPLHYRLWYFPSCTLVGAQDIGWAIDRVFGYEDPGEMTMPRRREFARHIGQALGQVHAARPASAHDRARTLYAIRADLATQLALIAPRLYGPFTLTPGDLRLHG